MISPRWILSPGPVETCHLETGQSGAWRLPHSRGCETPGTAGATQAGSRSQLPRLNPQSTHRYDLTIPEHGDLEGEFEDPVNPAAGGPCYAALDLAASKDLTALVLTFQDVDGSFDVVLYCWLPGETLLERMDEDDMPYAVWAKKAIY